MRKKRRADMGDAVERPMTQDRGDLINYYSRITDYN